MSLVCEKCVKDDPGLKQFISAKGQFSGSCDYCNETSSSEKVIELNKLTAHISSCLKESFETSESQSERHEFLTLSGFMEKYFPVQGNGLFQDTKSLLEEDIREKYLIEKILINDWDDFSNYIKKETRFFFSPKSDILKKAMKIIKNNNLIKSITPSCKKKIYRARAFKEGDRIVYDLRRMGPPEPEDVTNISNRLSPPGVPILYASFDRGTALSEISQEGRKGIAYISEFHFLNEITVIDLTVAQDTNLPSFFDLDQNNRKKRGDLLFIQELSAKLSEPIDKNGGEHTDYVPTQILAEYMKKEENIHGIIYESGRDIEGKNIALFLSQKNICENEKDAINSEVHLKFVKEEKEYKVPHNLKTSDI